MKKKPNGIVIEPTTVSKLFYIYKEFIFFDNEYIQWCVSVFVKSQQLADDDIEWLLENWQESEHLLNRILRYPVNHPKIFNWAQKTYSTYRNDLRRRLSELIALLITDDVPAHIVEHESKECILWAIYWAGMSVEAKQPLLKKYFSIEALDATLEISSRLDLPEVLEHALEEISVQK